MWRNLSIAAVIVCVVAGVGVSDVRANIFVTLDGDNLTDIITLADYPGQFIMAVEGDTPFGPNDISVEAVNGALEDVGDGNESYYFQLAAEGEAAVNLITKVDMVIDGVSVPADTLIYQLWLCYNPYINIYAAYGIGLSELYIPPEEEQDQPIAEQPAEQSGISTEESPSETQSQPVNDCNSLPLTVIGVDSKEDGVPVNDYNSLPMTAVRQERRKVLLNCPNSVDEIPFVRAAREKPESFAMPDANGGLMLLDGVVEVSSDITTNQIWTANNTYHITAGINVQALLVIEPGTIVEFAYDTAMYVNNGGTLISSGTPDNLIIYTCDFLYPDWGYYWQYLPDYGNYYFCPIYIEETASPATTVTYSFIEGALAGIVTNNIKLDHPIENNYLFGNIYGIGEYGTRHTDITNNLCYYNYTAGVDVYLADVSGVGDANSVITISNNTCDTYQDYGITVHGVENEADAGYSIISNNIVSGAYQLGLNLVDGYMSFTVSNTGYYENYANKNWNFDEYYPIIETQMPYITGEDILSVCFLRQDCNFINKGYEYIEQTRLIGKTTDVNNFPDSNYTDLGFHYPNWNFSNAGDGNSLPMDLNADLIVNFKDFAVLADGWRIIYDINDLNVMADEWLNLADPNIQIQISGNPNNGSVDISVSGYSPDTQQIFLLADGKYIGNIFDFRGGYALTMDISGLGNGEHQLKAISSDSNSHITCSNIKPVTFSNPFTYCSMAEHYVKNQPLYFAGIYNSTGNVSVNVYANGGNLVWSQTYSENNIFGAIPVEITNQYDFDYVTFTEDSMGLLASGGGASVIIITDPVEPPIPGIQALIILPDRSIRLAHYKQISQIKTAFKNRSIAYNILFEDMSTYDIIAAYAATSPIKYIYIDAHSGYGKDSTGTYYFDDGVLRTLIQLPDCYVVSMKQSDFLPGQAPLWCKSLGSYWEPRVKSFYSMGFYNIEFAYFNGCYTGRLKITQNGQLVEGPSGQQGLSDGVFQSDMSIALGMDETSRTRIYQGWWGLIPIGAPPPYQENEYQKWIRLEWQYLGEGEDLYSAIYDVIWQQTDFGPDAPVNNYRLRGQGFLLDIILRNW